jgi:alpha-1,3-glucosyltransferase
MLLLLLRLHPSGQSTATRLWFLAAILLQPASLLIDHGHFQYNNISLGLATAAASVVAAGYDCAGSALFCLALNHKQASAMHSSEAFWVLNGGAYTLPSSF